MNHEAGEKLVVMLCYHFPPVNNGGVQRSLYFFRSLPNLGWDTRVITTDVFLLKLGASRELNVIYSGEPESFFAARDNRSVQAPKRCTPRPTGRISGFLSIARRTVSLLHDLYRKWVLIPDREIFWALGVVRPALAEIRKSRNAVIYSTSPPEAAHIGALVTKFISGRPWVLDLRDPWVLEPIKPYLQKSRLRRSIESRLESLCVRHASAVILNTESALHAYQTRFPLQAKKMRNIPNGFDPEVLAIGCRAEKEIRNRLSIPQGVTIVSHIGTFSRQENNNRVPPELLGVAQIMSRDTASRVKFVLAGDSRRSKIEVDEAGLSDMFIFPGLVPHQDAIKLMLASSVLMLFDDENEGRYYVRGKAYEYLAAAVPIVAVVPDGETRKLLSRSPYARFSPKGSAEALMIALQHALALKVPKAAQSELGELVGRYSYGSISRSLSSLLDSVVSTAERS